MIICKLDNTENLSEILKQKRITTKNDTLNEFYRKCGVHLFTSFDRDGYKTFLTYPSTLELPENPPHIWTIDTGELTDDYNEYRRTHIVLTEKFTKPGWEAYYWLTYSYGCYYYSNSLKDLPSLSINRLNRTYSYTDIICKGYKYTNGSLQSRESPVIMGITLAQANTFVERYAKLFLSEFPFLRPSAWLYDHNLDIEENTETFLKIEGEDNSKIKAFLKNIKETCNA